MKKREPLDDLFQDRLKDFSLEAPMHLWDNIAEAAVPEVPKRKHKGLLWFWLLPLLLLTGITWAYWANISGNDQAVELDSFPIPRVTTAPAAVASSANTSLDESIAGVQDQSLSNQKNLALIAANETSANLANKKSSAALIIAKAVQDKNEMAVDGAASNPKKVDQDGSSLALSTEITTISETETASPIAALNDQANTSNTLPEDQPAASELLSEQANALPSWLLDPLSGPLLLVDNPMGDEELSFPAFKEAKSWLTTVDLMASMDFVMRQLEAKDSEYDDYARLRDNTETFRHGVSVGMRFSTISETGFAVRSGLNYSAINEQLNFKIREEEKLTITTKYDVDGSIIGADTSIQVVGTYRIVNNRYTELDIPLLIGYEYIGDKISFSFNGGTFINMLSAQKGEFVSPNSEEPVSFSSSDPNSYRAFKNRVGLGFYGSMGVYFQVKDNLQVLLEPYAKWRPGSYTVDSYFLDQRFLTTGLFVGVRKKII